ncbi:MAG TPA: hypothetical protein VMH83_04250 [Candidatus Acidoferrum sp.]|nr:hypothetical protein [Candidatus Acidoferrum sp.]
MNKPKRPKDITELAKQIADISADVMEPDSPDYGKNPAAMMLGRLGGLKGGKARAANLSSKRKSEIAKLAAEARWRKK